MEMGDHRCILLRCRDDRCLPPIHGRGRGKDQFRHLMHPHRLQDPHRSFGILPVYLIRRSCAGPHIRVCCDMIHPLCTGKCILPAILQEVIGQKQQGIRCNVSGKMGSSSGCKVVDDNDLVPPRATSASARWDPINPAPPVMIDFIADEISSAIPLKTLFSHRIV